MTESFPQSRKIGLALSGGGVRAAAFHAGVLLWLAEHGQLENVKHISSVSGGSLVTGLVFHASGYKWPSSEEYIKFAYPHIKKTLTEKSLQSNAIARLIFHPTNWRFILSRANVIAQSIERLWGINGSLSRLPLSPTWSINGTTAENGKRFRFKDGKGGDYEIGYADFSSFDISKAMAVSAAFPGGIGPVSFEVKSYKWHKKDHWSSNDPPSEYIPEYKTLHIYDGGLYDNLGLEPMFDVGQRKIKAPEDDDDSIDFIIVSDAGSPIPRIHLPRIFKLRRFLRFMAIVMEQARSLRVRVFVNFLQQNPLSGMYLQIGSDPKSRINKFSKNTPKAIELKKKNWLSLKTVESVAALPTTLDRMNIEDFDMAAQHGYETVDWNTIFLD